MRRLIVEIDDATTDAETIIAFATNALEDFLLSHKIYVSRTDRMQDSTTTLRVSKNEWQGLTIDRRMIERKLRDSGLPLEALLLEANALPVIKPRSTRKVR